MTQDSNKTLIAICIGIWGLISLGCVKLIHKKNAFLTHPRHLVYRDECAGPGQSGKYLCV